MTPVSSASASAASGWTSLKSMPRSGDAVAVLLVERLQRRHLQPAGLAAGLPQVDDHRTAQRRQVDVGAAAEAGQRHVGQSAVDRLTVAGRAVVHADARLDLAQRRGVDLDVGRADVESPAVAHRRAGRERRRRRGRGREQSPHAGPCVVTSFSASIGSVGTGAERRAQPGDRAGAACRLLGMAAPAAVPDEVVGEHRPVALGEEGADGVLDLDRVGLLGPAEAAREPAEVGVDGDAGHAEGVAEHDVGGLATRRRAGSPGRRGGRAPGRRRSRRAPG